MYVDNKMTHSKIGIMFFLDIVGEVQRTDLKPSDLARNTKKLKSQIMPLGRLSGVLQTPERLQKE